MSCKLLEFYIILELLSDDYNSDIGSTASKDAFYPDNEFQDLLNEFKNEK